MEKIKNNNYAKSTTFQSDDFNGVIKIFLFSFLGILIFFIPIQINNQSETIIYHISYYLENKISPILEISLVLFVVLSTLRNVFTKEKTFFSKFYIIMRVLSIIILICFVFEKEYLFITDDKFIFIMRDLITSLIIFLPVAAIFMPLLVEYGLIEIVEAYTHKIMKKSFKVSGKVFLNFLVYLFVDNICGAFLTYKLYEDGKLREKEACITILNFSILSFSLTSDLCNKINISKFKFILLEIGLLIICNIVICRIYPLNKKKQSYYVKSGYKDVNCKKHKLSVAIKKHINKKNDKNLIGYSLSYLNESMEILMDLIPNIIIIFFLWNIFFNIPYVVDNINNLIYIIIKPFRLPNIAEIAGISNASLFNSILGIKTISVDTYYLTKIILSLIISLQCINISFIIPFIKKSVIPLNIREILLVCLQRYIIIIFLSSVIYYFYINYII